jgi:hypothetical protein
MHVLLGMDVYAVKERRLHTLLQVDVHI